MTTVPLEQAERLEEPAAMAVLSAIGSPIVVIDKECRIIFVNHAAEDFLGCSFDHLHGLRLADVVGFDTPLMALVEQAHTRGSVVVNHAAELHICGSNRQAMLQASPIDDGSQAIVVLISETGLAGRLDGQVGRSGLAKSIGAMSAMLAHEIKNPLAAIRGAAQLVEPSLKVDDQTLTKLIRDECDRVCNLVDRMDTMAGLTLARDAVNIHAVLDRVLQLARSGFAPDVVFSTEYDPSLPAAFGDRDQLVQVFLNLVKNAAAVLPDQGGRVVISTRYRHDVRVNSHEGMDIPLEVSICDNGSGIPGDIQAHIFDPFVTTRAGGTGLGLALVAKVVAEHGGSVEFTSDHAGTDFRVRLPVVAERQQRLQSDVR